MEAKIRKILKDRLGEHYKVPKNAIDAIVLELAQLFAMPSMQKKNATVMTQEASAAADNFRRTGHHSGDNKPMSL